MDPLDPHSILPSRAEDQQQEWYEQDISAKEDEIWESFKDAEKGEMFAEAWIADPNMVLGEIGEVVSNGLDIKSVEAIIHRYVKNAAQYLVERK